MAGVSSVPEIRLALIGKVGAGKSCLGNSLLKKNEFVSRQDSRSVTTESLLGKRRLMLNGIETELKVVDTPGLFSMGKKNSNTVKEIVQCIELLSPGPHAFIFVIKIGRLTHEDQKVLNYFKDTFGELVDRFGVVVFTGSDLLNGISFKDWIQGTTSTFKSFLKRCKNRYTIINNLDNLERKTRDLDNILNLVQNTIKANHGEFYQNEMFEEAKNLFEEKLKDERKKRCEERKKEREEREKEREKEREEREKEREKEREEREKEREEWNRKEQELLARIQKYSVEYQESSSHAKRRRVIPRREGGTMLPEDEYRIKSNYVYLIENLSPLEPLLDSLTEKYVLDEDDLEKIRRAESRSTKTMIRKFLDILLTCGINAYPKFIHCLKKSGYGPVAEQLASDIDMDGIVEREEKQSREDNKYLQLQERLQQIKQEQQEKENALHISTKENQRIKTTLNSLRIALKKKTSIFVRFKSELRTKTKLLDKLKEERDTRNEDLQMTKVRNSTLRDELERLNEHLERIYEQNFIIDRIKEEIDDDDNRQDVGLNDSDDSTVDVQATDGKLVIKQEPVDVDVTDETADSDHGLPTYIDETADSDHSLPTDIDETADSDYSLPTDIDETADSDHSLPTDIDETSDSDHGLPTDIDETADSDHSLPTDEKSFDAITKEDHVKTTDVAEDISGDQTARTSDPVGLAIKQEPVDIDETLSPNLRQGTDDTYDVIDEENKGMTIPDDKTTYKNTMDVDSICFTCRDGTLDDVKNLILHNKDFNIRDELRLTPLFYCVWSEYQPLEKVKLLVSTGARLDVKDKDGRSLLHWACYCSTTIECIKYLLEQGLDKDARDYINKTPLFYCVPSYYNQVEKMKLLVSTGAMVDVKDYRGCSLLDVARWFDRTECETYLRELGLDK